MLGLDTTSPAWGAGQCLAGPASYGEVWAPWPPEIQDQGPVLASLQPCPGRPWGRLAERWARLPRLQSLFLGLPVAVLTLEKFSGLELRAGRPHAKLQVCSAVLSSWWPEPALSKVQADRRLPGDPGAEGPVYMWRVLVTTSALAQLTTGFLPRRPALSPPWSSLPVPQSWAWGPAARGVGRGPSGRRWVPRPQLLQLL